MRGIAHLAKVLGISTGTVSRALNGRPDVSPETRSRVLEAARHMGYAPNQAARTLAQGETRSVGFMIDLHQETAASSDYFFMGVFDGVQSVIAPHGLDLLVLPCPSDQDRFAYLERFVTRGVVDAMILAAVQYVDPRIDLLHEAGIPFATLGRSSSSMQHAWIDLDFEGAVETALERLISRGHRRIAVTIPYGEVNFGYVFLAAYKDVMARHGVAFDPELVFVTRRNEAAGYKAMEQMLDLDEPPTAVLLIYEVTAIGIYRKLRDSGLEPGRDIAVVGFRDEPTTRFLMPTLTCFKLSLTELGVAVGRALMAQIPRFQDEFPGGLVQARHPLMLQAGESDSCSPPPDRRTRSSDKRFG
ncbi:substrate-binding domain-containing protein [Rhizobium sp. LjRoot254]|uniref:substrate-binding domain-containing protein n=1 Tax=Rhizobium sp. LjRoot254 TaxID=3342297 RepID=UPI003ECD3136